LLDAETEMSIEWLLVLCVGAFFGLLCTRTARDFAARVGLVDAPDGRRKTQIRAVPVAGGVAVLVAAGLALAVSAVIFPDVSSALTESPTRSIAMLIAAVLIVAVGVADDRYSLRARFKLLGQLIAVLVLVIPGGLEIQQISLLGWAVQLDNFSIPFTIFWFLACINALNLIDGMDGLLGTVGLIALLTMAVIATITGHHFTAAVALAMSGAVLGFLWFNLPPATIYMGDAGSMLIGLMIGALAIPASLKGPATVALMAPVAVLVLPMLDTTAAIVRRKLTGRGLATADRGHLHHVLLRNGLTVRRILVLVASLALVASAGALATTALQNDVYAIIAVFGVVIALVTTRLFGNAEFQLVKARLSAAIRGLRQPGGPGWEMAIRLQGTADWDQVWQDLTGCAGRMNLQTVWLDVNAPSLHENYHARWDRAGVGHDETHLWRVEIPLFGNGQPIGRLAVTGGRDEESIAEKMHTVGKIIEAAEIRVSEVATFARPAIPSEATMTSPIGATSPVVMTVRG
jgi:UDP-GlcNAc:undecaprenyl-phosphate/decaprenyl-phosphate GlcNAc-1-phosphate transferase